MKTGLSKKWLIIFLIAIIGSAAVFFNVGYHIGYKTGYEAAYLMPVRIGYLVADIHQIAFFVAYYQGFYEEEGIRPIRLEYVNGPAQMLAFASGELDAGYVGIVPALISKSKGADFKIMASANLEGSAIITKPEIKSAQDLDGKTVGTPGLGTIQDALLSLFEKKYGVSTIHKSYSGPSQLPLDFEKGEIDAYISWEPFVAEAYVKGWGNINYTSHDILPLHQCCIFYVSGKIFREQPDLAKRLVRVHVKAMKYVVENPEDAQKIFAERTGKSLNVVQESWKRMIWDYHLNVTSIETFANYLIEQSKIESADVPNVKQFIENMIDTQVLAEVEKSGA
ncbi:MAG: ABC transporter substrate-binding protein [Candidatus Bathyarchaeia archaeon]